MSVFVTTENQIANAREWNKKREWGFKDADFNRIQDPPESPPDRFPLATRVLVPYLPPLSNKHNSTYQTARELMESLCPGLIGSSQFAPSHLLPHVDEPEPGFRWEVIDLGANLGHDPNACADRDLSPHAGILAAACHFPRWMEMVDKEELPGVWITGYADSYKIALFRNHDSRVSKNKNGILELGGYSPGLGSRVGNRAIRPLAVARFR